MTYYHGGARTRLHSGVCLVDDPRAAWDYAQGRGARVDEIEVDLADLNVVEAEVTRAMIDAQEFPGDTSAEREALIAEGIDAIEYDDMSPEGRTHRTLRLLSPLALASARVVTTYREA